MPSGRVETVYDKFLGDRDTLTVIENHCPGELDQLLTFLVFDRTLMVRKVLNHKVFA